MGYLIWVHAVNIFTNKVAVVSLYFGGNVSITFPQNDHGVRIVFSYTEDSKKMSNMKNDRLVYSIIIVYKKLLYGCSFLI